MAEENAQSNQRNVQISEKKDAHIQESGKLVKKVAELIQTSKEAIELTQVSKKIKIKLMLALAVVARCNYSNIYNCICITFENF